MDSQQIAWYLRIQKPAEDYASTIAVAVTMYDYVLTLPLEVDLIWFSRWTYTKVLLLLLRYIIIVDVWMFLYIQVFRDVSLSTCRLLWPAAVWISITTVNLAEVILTVRTWAVWGRSRIMGIVLAITLSISLIPQIMFAQRGVKSVRVPPFTPFNGCYSVTSHENFWIIFVTLAGVEAFLLFIMVTSAFQTYQWGCNTELWRVIHRDGIMQYLYLLVLTVANVLAVKLFFLDFLILPQIALYSVFTTRIIFNIRSAARGKRETELHTFATIEFRGFVTEDDVVEEEDYIELQVTKTEGPEVHYLSAGLQTV